MRVHRVKFGPCVLALATGLISGSVQAQDAAASTQQVASDPSQGNLAEIVVTAEHRSADVQKVPAAVAVRNGDDLRDEGRFSLRSILEDVPGVTGGAQETPPGSNGSGSDIRAPGLSFRGIPSNAGAGGSLASVAPASAVYVDGVYEGVGGDFDIGQVEVLRGPQGTLYGRSATAGLVAIRTRNPDLSDFGLNLNGEFGNYDLRRYGGYLNVPIVDDVLGLRVSGNRYERNGYYNKFGDALGRTDIKVKALFKPTDNFSLLAGFALEDNATHSGGVTISQTAPGDFLITPAGVVAPGKNHFRQYWAEANWTLGGVTLTYIPAYRTWSSNTLLINRGVPGSENDQTAATPTDHFLTNEIRLASSNSSRLRWQTGVFIYHNNIRTTSTAYNYNGVTDFGFPNGTITTDIRFHRATDAQAVFGEATYSLTDTTRLTGGLRYDHTKVATDETYFSNAATSTFVLTPDQGTRKFNNVTYKARVEHDFTPANLVYASVSTGFSPGDVSVSNGLNGLPATTEFRDETLTEYEIGSKNRFFDNKAQLNVAAFYNDYGGYQTANIAVGTTFSPLAMLPVPEFATLRSPIHAYGAEAEAVYRVTRHDILDFNLAYVRSRFVDTSKYPVPGTNLTFSSFFARRRVPGVIPWLINGSYTHTIDLGSHSSLALRGVVRFQSKHDESPILQEQINAGFGNYVSVSNKVFGDADATVKLNRHFTLTGYIRNIGNVHYPINPQVFTIALPPPLGTLHANTTNISDPRTYGVVANVDF